MGDEEQPVIAWTVKHEKLQFPPKGLRFDGAIIKFFKTPVSPPADERRHHGGWRDRHLVVEGKLGSVPPKL